MSAVLEGLPPSTASSGEEETLNVGGYEEDKQKRANVRRLGKTEAKLRRRTATAARLGRLKLVLTTLPRVRGTGSRSVRRLGRNASLWEVFPNDPRFADATRSGAEEPQNEQKENTLSRHTATMRRKNLERNRGRLPSLEKPIGEPK